MVQRIELEEQLTEVKQEIRQLQRLRRRSLNQVELLQRRLRRLDAKEANAKRLKGQIKHSIEVLNNPE